MFSVHFFFFDFLFYFHTALYKKKGEKNIIFTFQKEVEGKWPSRSSYREKKFFFRFLRQIIYDRKSRPDRCRQQSTTRRDTKRVFWMYYGGRCVVAVDWGFSVCVCDDMNRMQYTTLGSFQPTTDYHIPPGGNLRAIISGFFLVTGGFSTPSWLDGPTTPNNLVQSGRIGAKISILSDHRKMKGGKGGWRWQWLLTPQS